MSAERYLANLQRAFGAMLRTPLDRSTHTLRATVDAYPPELVARVRGGAIDPRERLATYQRQYWFRLFTILHAELPLTTALVGAWDFNELAARYLAAHPPDGHELATITDAFPAFARAQHLPLDADALAIDVAFRKARLAPHDAPLRIGARDADALPRARLVWSRATSLVDEARPLMEVRRALPTPLGDHRAALPPRYPDGARTWIVTRTERGLRVAPLARAEAMLAHLLHELPLGEALAEVEAKGADGGAIQRWFADGVAHGYWTAYVAEGA